MADARGDLRIEEIEAFVGEVVGDDLHAKRVYSLANGTQGVMASASLAVGAIGQGLALVQGKLGRHAVKQVDRLLSNPGIDIDELLMHWVPYCVGERKAIEVAMDWTDFDADGQATIMLSLLTSHGRATPLVWLTVDKATLKNNRSRYEHQVLVRLAEALSAEVQVLILADRGFADRKLYEVLTDELKFDYLIRLRGNITVTDDKGEMRPAIGWLPARGRTRVLRGCAVTHEGYPVGAAVFVQAKDMKAPWCLVTSRKDDKVKTLLATYAKRWEIECQFRDAKNPRFGLGMSQVRIKTPERRDRLWLLNAFAGALLTLLGAAGEAIGFDKHLRTSTTKRRVHSLFRQGCMHYQFIPTMREDRLRALMEKFGELLLQQRTFAAVYGLI